MRRKKQPESQPLQSQETTENQSPEEKEKPGQSLELFQADSAPHEGNINEAPVLEEEAQTETTEQPRARRGRKPGRKKAEVEEEITKDDIDDMQFALDMLLYTPAELYLKFATPEEKQQLRMARIAARLHNKYFGKNCSDEFKLIELLTFWILVNCWRKFGGNRGQRNNGSVREEETRKNPLDAPLLAPTN